MIDNLKCVIFDMDGVIIDSEQFHKKAYFETFKQLNIHVTEAQYKNYHGASTINMFQQLVKDFKLDHNPEDLVLIKRGIYVQLVKEDASFHLIEGVLELIQYFYNKGCKLVLASSSSMQNINMTFNRFDLDQYFIGKISGADLPKSKPHPEIFIKAAELANTPKENCIVIEDSKNGIKAANAANILSVAYYPEDSDQDVSEAKIKVETFKELQLLF